MLSTVQTLYTDNGQQVGTYTGNIGSHLVQQMAELLDIRFTGGVVDRRRAFSQHGSHDDVGRTGHAGFVEKHVGALEMLGPYLKDAAILTVLKLGAEFLEAKEVSVKTAAPDLVSSGLGHCSLTKATKQWAKHQHRAAQGSTLLHKLQAVEIVEIELVCLKRIVAGRIGCHLHPDVLEQSDQIVDVENIRDIADPHCVAREQRGADHLQSLVLGTLRHDGSTQGMAAFDNE